MKFETAGVLGTGLVGALFTTIRARRHGAEHYLRFRERGEPVIFVFWHAQLLPLVHYHRHEGIVVLVSEHADGEYITRVIERYGFGAVRGSSTRGGLRGLRALARAARQGRDLALTPDGPRGPARKFKPGALTAARMTGLPIIPMAAGASSSWRLPSWDGFMVPRPLSRVSIAYGPPRYVARRTSWAEVEALGLELTAELNRLTARVDPGEASGVEVGQAP